MHGTPFAMPPRMPSLEHEMLVDLLREHPALVLELLRVAFGVDHRGTSLEILAAAESLTDVQPPERRADLVFVTRSPGSSAVTRAYVVEVQLRPDPRKRWTWPVYQAVLRDRLTCPVTLVVLTMDRATAAWAAKPIELDDHGSRTAACVIGPALVPIVADVERARRHPEIALLSVLAHRDTPLALSIARALFVALDDVDEPRARWYAEITLGFVDEAVRRALEVEMNPEKYALRSEFLRRIEADGEARGEARGVARALLAVLAARDLPVSDAQRSLVLACDDQVQLDDWLRRAVHVRDADELFGSER